MLRSLNTFLKGAATAAFAAAMATGAFAQEATGEPIKIGVVLSVTGPAAPFGISERDAFEILVKKQNSEGGINGRPLEIVFYDDQSNPTESARGVTKLIQQDGVVALFGPTMGTGTLAAAPIMEANEVPTLAPNGTISITSKENSFFPWVFRSAYTEQISIDGVMEEGVFKPGHKRFAIMYQEDAYGKTAADYAVKLAEERGLEVVANMGAPLTAIDLTAVATKIRNAKPEVVLLQTSAPPLGAAFVRAAKQVGLEAQIVGSSSLNQKPFLDAVGSAGEGVIVVGLGNWDDPSEKEKKLAELLMEHGKTPKGYAELCASMGFVALTEAIKRVEGEITGRKIRDALETLTDVENPYLNGTLTFNSEQHDGYTKEIMSTIVIENGKFKTLK